MSNYPPFYQTGLGRKFYEKDIPKLSESLDNITNELIVSNTLKVKELDLREQELTLKEKEIDIREHELTLKIKAERSI